MGTERKKSSLGNYSCRKVAVNGKVGFGLLPGDVPV